MIALPSGYEFSEEADCVAAHAFLTESYWAKGISLDDVRRAFAASFLVSVWFGGSQVGMARVVSDYVTFAYLNDVYVLPSHSGKGIAKAMLAYLRNHPRFREIHRWALFTKDAQSLYEGAGWKQYPWPERMMIIDPKMFPA